MGNRYEQHNDTDLVGMLNAVLDALTDDRPRSSAPAERLRLAIEAVRVASRAQTWLQQLVAGIDADEVAAIQHGTSTTTWLADAARLTHREARRLIRAGDGLRQFAAVGRAARSGALLAVQAEAITGVLAELPTDFDPASVADGEAMMVRFAGTHNSAELRRLTCHLVEVLFPETAEAGEAIRLERELKRARGSRSLEFFNDGHGSVLIRGSLPLADAEPFRKLVDSYAAQLKRGVEALDPLQPTPTAAQRRADALVRLVHRHQQQSLAPCLGGDRPRLVVTMSYDKLVKQAADAGLLAGFPSTAAADDCSRAPLGAGAIVTATGAPVAPSTVRQLLCDAEVLPVVLGGASQILDVGRSERLVTAGIRTALDQRDRGCVFPGCAATPEHCHAHHIVPWVSGGPTSLGNLVLLCPHHHAIIEPSSDPTADRWSLTLRADGVSEIRPPRRVDQQRRARIHARFLTRRRT